MKKARDHYTFGDGQAASERLCKLAELYEPEARLLLAGVVRDKPLAVDLGCGPGWSTELLHELARPARTVGLDSSSRYVTEARARASQGVSYCVHDVTRAPFPCKSADVLFCRFLLTHLADPAAVLNVWAEAARAGAQLFVHETAYLRTDNPTLARYYAWTAELQAHYGQRLYVGTSIEACFDPLRWTIAHSEVLDAPKPARLMADLHLRNLRTWRMDPFIRGRRSPEELSQLQQELEEIVSGRMPAADVHNGCRHIVALRR